MKKVLFVPYHKPTVDMFYNVKKQLDKKNIESVFVAYEKQAKKELKKKGLFFYNKNKNIKNVLNEIQPDLVATPHNLNPLGFLFMRNAKHLGIPTVIVHEGGSEQIEFLGRKKPQENHDARLLPLSLYDIFNLAVFKTIKSFKTNRASQYIAHSYSDVITVTGEKSKCFIQSLGVKSKIIVTGQPRFDDIVNKRFHPDETRKKYVISSDKKLVVLLTSIVVVDGLWEPDKLRFFVEFIDKMVKQLDAQLIVKIHPREDYGFYREIGDDLKVTKQDLYELINIADFVVSIPSTTTLEALMLKKNVLIPDFLTEKPYSQELKNNGFEDFVFKTDGQSSKRVADVLEEMIKF